MADRKRYAVVGLGSRMFTTAILKEYPDRAQLVAFCDPNQTRMDYYNQYYAEILDAPPVPTYKFDQFDQMLEEQRVDTVIVTSIGFTTSITTAASVGSRRMNDGPCTPCSKPAPVSRANVPRPVVRAMSWIIFSADAIALITAKRSLIYCWKRSCSHEQRGRSGTARGRAIKRMVRPAISLIYNAAADVPGTFGPDWMRLAGRDPMPGIPPAQGGRADMLLGKFASSAAHVAGKPLCSSEAFTWLDEHGKVPLDQLCQCRHSRSGSTCAVSGCSRT